MALHNDGGYYVVDDGIEVIPSGGTLSEEQIFADRMRQVTGWACRSNEQNPSTLQLHDNPFEHWVVTATKNKQGEWSITNAPDERLLGIQLQVDGNVGERKGIYFWRLVSIK